MFTHATHFSYRHLFALCLALMCFGLSHTASAQTPEAILTVNNGPSDVVADGSSVTLDWWTNATTNCQLTDVGAVEASGSESVVVSGVAAKTYTLTCDGVTDSVTVYVMPEVSVTPSDTSVTRQGDGSVNLNLNFDSEYATACGPLIVAYPGGTSGVLATAGALSDSGTFAVPDGHLIENGTYAFRLTCSNDSTGVSETVWSDDVAISGSITYTPPACPLIAEDGEILLTFDSEAKLFGYQPYDLSRSATEVEPITVEADTYDVRIVTWDGYPSRNSTNQANERVKIAFTSTLSPTNLYDGRVVVSSASPDLADNIQQATQNAWIHRTSEGTPFTITESQAAAIVGARAEHADDAVYTGAGDPPPGSVVPVCALLVPTGVSTDEPEPEAVAVDIAPHIPSFGLSSMGSWVPDGYAGTWSNVVLRDRISNLSTVDISTVVSSIEYVFGVDFDNRLPAYTAEEDAGSYNGGIAPNAQSPSQTTTYDDMPFGDHVFSVQLDPDAEIPNEDPANNYYERTISVPVPQPPMELIADPELVQIGDTVELTYTVNVGYELNCALYGPGVSGTVFSTAAGPIVDETMTSGALENTVTFALQCTEPITDSTFTEIAVVEVVPEQQEI